MHTHRITTGLTGLAAATGLLLGASLFSLDTAQAKPDEDWHSNPAKGVETHLERMADQLDLTETQQTEIRQILDADRAQRDQQRQATRKQIDALLTDEQKAKHDAMARPARIAGWRK